MQRDQSQRRIEGVIRARALALDTSTANERLPINPRVQCIT